MTRLEFGATTICRFCRGTSRGGRCAACDGVGFTLPAPTTADENSREAAASIEPVAGRMRRQVLELIRAHGPISNQELEALMHAAHSSVSARVWELHREGRIVRDGKGTTPAGRRCWLYVVAP